MIRDIVKDSTKLRDGLKKRWEELGLTQDAVAEDARKLGMKNIRRQAINRYLKNPYAPNALNQEQIIFLAWRWEIFVSLAVGKPSRSIEYNVPVYYNEERALKKLKQMFPKIKLPK